MRALEFDKISCECLILALGEYTTKNDTENEWDGREFLFIYIIFFIFRN